MTWWFHCLQTTLRRDLAFKSLQDHQKGLLSSSTFCGFVLTLLATPWKRRFRGHDPLKSNLDVVNVRSIFSCQGVLASVEREGRESCRGLSRLAQVGLCSLGAFERSRTETQSTTLNSEPLTLNPVMQFKSSSLFIHSPHPSQYLSA